MLSSLAESVIQRLCGRYLKNFSNNNVNVSLSGVITLTNIELNVSELATFQLPYKPTRVFIGSAYLDLPLVLGGHFDVRVSDLLVVLEKNEDLATVDPALLNRALQAWIGIAFLALSGQSGGFPSASEEKTTVSSAEVEYTQKLFERLLLTLDNVHIRIEESYSSHLSVASGVKGGTKLPMCLGLQIGKLEVRNPQTTAEQGAFASMASHSNARNGVVLDKVFKLNNLNVYCTREQPIGRVDDASFNIDLVKKSFFVRSNQSQHSTIVAPLHFECLLSVKYQRSNLMFGPVCVQINFGEANVTISDEQIAYLLHVADSLEHFHYRWATMNDVSLLLSIVNC
jgi:hypothetical protein